MEFIQKCFKKKAAPNLRAEPLRQFTVQIQSSQTWNYSLDFDPATCSYKQSQQKLEDAGNRYRELLSNQIIEGQLHDQQVEITNLQTFLQQRLIDFDQLRKACMNKQIDNEVLKIMIANDAKEFENLKKVTQIP